MPTSLRIGTNPVRPCLEPVVGQRVTLEGEAFYQIANSDRMRPFLLSVVSSADHWMFVSSTGALTAGRTDPDGALFPYYTEDKIHDAAESTGSKTVLIVQHRGRSRLWEPFSERYRGIYRIRRSLFKNTWGNKLIFEEDNEDFNLTFRYGWFNSQRFGFVRKAWLSNAGSDPVRIRLLDGIQNLMPCGVGSQFQLEKSVLLDAYKRNELLPETGLALFRLSSIPIDRPESAEALRTTVAWSLGLDRCRRLLSTVQVERFRQGMPVREETDVRAERGAYLVQSAWTLRGGQTAHWFIVADVSRGSADVAELDRRLRCPSRLRSRVLADIDRGTQELQEIVASADGLQKTAEPLGDARHANNVLANLMRGGIFDRGYRVDPRDLQAFVRQANADVAARHTAFFRRLPAPASYADLVTRAAATGDAQLERLSREYLPLTFSRRHGDPSRPWNRFSIASRTSDGRRVLNYEGNWRDIFQNWEALAISFPGYLPGMISRFVSASTADGYNPYRIARHGIDWEVPDPSDPWAYIGYWGDHQLIYLLKLLELLHRHQPSTFQAFLTRDLFAYANVPYRIKPYEHLLEDPKNTVVFDASVEDVVRRRVQAIGSDGRLLWDAGNQVQLVNLTEKLLVSILAKLSSFIPGAGIWLNTQRPEWNDANNALVGQGVSVVTLFHLRRYLAFCVHLFAPLEAEQIGLCVEVRQLFVRVGRVLEDHRLLLARPINDRDRKRILDELGRAGSRYRQGLYTHGFSGRRSWIHGARLLRFFRSALDWVDHTLAANRRPDRLYHAYNLVRFRSPSEISIRRLHVMLEGQVAALDSGRLTAAESADLLGALERSTLYRSDQHSYLLYPNRDLPRFMDRNNIPARDVARSRLLTTLLAKGDRSLAEKDVRGRCHFSGLLTNALDLRQALERLAGRGFRRLVQQESEFVLALFERLFDHESFTGRSGTFFGYEGLGSVYWHMVSKLLLAVQTAYVHATETGATLAVLRRLAQSYHDVRAGIGDRKTPDVYGAFPMDPYSHTPAHAGARQPGLTGQVKEDILSRFGELGVIVSEGRISFRPRLLSATAFLPEATRFDYLDVTGTKRRLRLPPRSLAFTYCQLPVVYHKAPEARLVVTRADGTEERLGDPILDEATSGSILERSGKVVRITVFLKTAPIVPRSAANDTSWADAALPE